MNNDALVAALGLDAVAAVHGYRLAVLAEADRRDLRLVSDALSGVMPGAGEGCVVVDPIDIRLAFGYARGRAGLAGRTLTWAPAHGWSLSHRLASRALCYYATADSVPLDLVPAAAEVVDWAVGDAGGSAAPPAGIELDDDPEAIRRLLSYIDPRCPFPPAVAFAPITARADEQR